MATDKFNTWVVAIGSHEFIMLFDRSMTAIDVFESIKAITDTKMITVHLYYDKEKTGCT